MSCSSTSNDDDPSLHGKHPKRGLARWLYAAPPSASFAEVVEAYKEYDAPSDAWPRDHTLDEFNGGDDE